MLQHMEPADVPYRDGWAPLDGASIGCARVGTDGRIAWANEALGKLIGQPAGMLRKRHLVDLVHPDDQEVVEGPGGPIRLVNGNGLVSVAMHAAPLPDGAGRIVLIEPAPDPD